MKLNQSENRIHTTLGELIATVSECAFEYADDPREAYNLARLVLVELLNEASHNREIIEPNFPGTLLVH